MTVEIEGRGLGTRFSRVHRSHQARKSSFFLRTPRKAFGRLVYASALGPELPGELGWSTARTDLALGTLVGTGSYGIVREAEVQGLQVRTCIF